MTCYKALSARCVSQALGILKVPCVPETHQKKSCAIGHRTIGCCLQVAFEGVGSMPMARIEGFREQKQEVVQVELRRRETRQQLQKAIAENDHSDHDVLSSRGIPWARLCSSQETSMHNACSTIQCCSSPISTSGRSTFFFSLYHNRLHCHSMTSAIVSKAAFILELQHCCAEADYMKV